MRKIVLFIVFAWYISFPLGVTAENEVNNYEELEKIIDDLYERLDIVNESFELLDEQVTAEQELNEFKQSAYQLLYEREKYKADSLYNFMTIFIIIITLYVSIIGGYITYLSFKLGKHQEKINKIYNSREYDQKINAIEQSLENLRLRERNNIKKQTKSEYYKLLSSVNSTVSNIEQIRNIADNDNVIRSLEFEYYIGALGQNSKEFENFKEINLKTEQDYDDNTTRPEEELQGLLGDLKTISNSIDNIYHKLKMPSL